MLRASLSVAADAAASAAAPMPRAVAPSCRARAPPSAPHGRRRTAAAAATAAATARPLGTTAAAAAAATTTALQPASWPLGGARRASRLAPSRAAVAATEAATTTATTTTAASPLLPPLAADALPAVERALAAVAAAAAAQGAPAPRVAARVFPTADGRGRLGLVATADAREGDVLLAVPESLAATAAGDAGESAAVADFLAAGTRGGGGSGGGGAEDTEDAPPAVSELVALALWVMAQRCSSSSSDSSSSSSSAGQREALVGPLPAATLSPVLWPEPERGALLRGSPALPEARERERQLRAQWARMVGGGASDAAAADSTTTTTTTKNNTTAIARMGEASFLRAFCAVVASAAYLPSAGCFALVPVVSSPALRRTCLGGGSLVDYDAGSGCAVLRCGPAAVRAGEEVTLEDGRPNGEFLLATGSLPGDDVDPAARAAGAGRPSSLSPAAAAVLAARVDNPADCLMFPAALLPADRLFAQKAEILAAAGLDPLRQAFPVRRDALPTQLLSYLRLARVQDPAQFARVSFEADVVVSQVNEYEVLQLLMGDCRERLSAYDTALEEECKFLQGQAQEMTAAARASAAAAGGGGGGIVAGVFGGNKAAAASGGAAAAGDAAPAGGAAIDSDAERRARERLAARLRAAEKAVLSATTDAVRRRLAPIRGVPTKGGGMQDPNSDLREIFEALEGIPSAPARALDTVRRWAKGEFDPDWNDKR